MTRHVELSPPQTPQLSYLWSEPTTPSHPTCCQNTESSLINMILKYYIAYHVTLHISYTWIQNKHPLIHHEFRQPPMVLVLENLRTAFTIRYKTKHFVILLGQVKCVWGGGGSKLLLPQALPLAGYLALACTQSRQSFTPIVMLASETAQAKWLNSFMLL